MCCSCCGQDRWFRVQPSLEIHPSKSPEWTELSTKCRKIWILNSVNLGLSTSLYPDIPGQTLALLPEFTTFRIHCQIYIHPTSHFLTLWNKRKLENLDILLISDVDNINLRMQRLQSQIHIPWLKYSPKESSFFKIQMAWSLLSALATWISTKCAYISFHYVIHCMYPFAWERYIHWSVRPDTPLMLGCLQWSTPQEYRALW